MASQGSAVGSSQDQEPLSDLEEEVAAAAEWAPYQEWADKFGRAALRTLNMDTEEEYLKWLQAQVGVGPISWSSSTVQAALHHLRADFSNKSGYRAVNPANLLQKMREIVRAKAWREWDIARLARVPEMDKAEEKPDPRPRYLDFHHRGCALHAICYSFMKQGMDLPDWAKGLVRPIKVKWEGDMKKVAFLGQGYGGAIAMQYGALKVTWLDIVLQIVTDSSMSAESGNGSLQAKIFEISPEHASKLNDWKNMRTLMTRVSPEAGTCGLQSMRLPLHGQGGEGQETWSRCVPCLGPPGLGRELSIYMPQRNKMPRGAGAQHEIA